MERSFPFNAALVDGEPDRVYTAEDFAAERAAYVSSGVLSASALTVSPASSGAFAIEVAPGCAVIDGYTYRNTSALPLSVPAANAQHDRIDLVLLRLDLAARHMQCVLVSGVAAENPSAPALTETDTVRELALAELRVAAGSTVIAADALTDRRIRADYILNRLEVEALLAEYEAALADFFSVEDAASLAASATVVRTDAGASQVLCGDGVYRAATLDGDKTVELARFTASGTFSPAAYPTRDGRYEILLQGGGGSGAYGAANNKSTGGGAGGFLIVSGVPLRSDKSYPVTVGAGGAAVYAAPICAGKDGGASSFAGFTAPGGRGGCVSSGEVPAVISLAGFTAEGGTLGEGGRGGSSLFGEGGANRYNGSGVSGGVGAGGGAGFISFGGAVSGAGGNGLVIIRGAV